jgi:hypothetical protein
VTLRGEQYLQLHAQRLASLISLSVLVVLVIAGAGGTVAGKHFEALAVLANVYNIRLQRRGLRESAGNRQNQK